MKYEFDTEEDYKSKLDEVGIEDEEIN